VLRFIVTVIAVWVGWGISLSAFGIETGSKGPCLAYSGAWSYWEDTTGELTVDGALPLYRQQRFTPHDALVPSQGFTKSAYWYAKRLQKSGTSCSSHWFFSVQYPNLDWLDVYFINDKGQILHQSQSGDRRSFDSRELLNRSFFFRVPLDQMQSEDTIVLLRAATSGAINLPNFLQSFEEVYREDHASQMLFGLYVGAIAVMACYYLVVGLMALHLESVFLGLFLIAIATYRLGFHGVTFEYLMPHYPRLANITVPSFGVLSALLLTLYSERFLGIARNTRSHKVSRVVSYTLCGLFIVTLYLEYKVISLAVICGIVVPLVWWMVGIYVWLGKSFAPAKYFVIAWSGFFVSLGFSNYMTMTSFRGFEDAMMLIITIPELALVFVTLLLSIAASEKYRYTNRLALDAQKRSLEAQIEARKATEEINLRLEGEVTKRTAELAHQTREMKTVFDAVRQGLCVIDEDCRIAPQFSAEMRGFVEVQDLKGQSLVDLVLKKTDLALDKIAEIETVVMNCMHEDLLVFEANNHVFPLTATLKHFDRSLDIEFAWDPITEDDETVRGLLVAIRDVTLLKAAEREAAEQRSRFDEISQVIAVAPAKMHLFLESANHLLAVSEGIAAQAMSDDDFFTVLRHLHTLKGNSRTYGLKALALAVHEAESTLIDVQKESPMGSAQILKPILQQLKQRVCDLRDINDKVLNRAGVMSVERHFAKFSRMLFELMPQLQGQHRQQISDAVADLFEAMSYRFFRNLRPMIRSLDDLAIRLDKQTPDVELLGEDFELQLDEIPYMEGIFVHLFRNSMDHGFGFGQQNKITVQVSHTPEQTLIRYRDNGRGLDMERLRARGLEAGLLRGDADAQAIAELIFHPGISSASTVTDISGRGVGMSAVRSIVSDLRGRVDLLLDPGRPGDTYLGFSILLVLPRFNRFADLTVDLQPTPLAAS
jgi:HPt (histidine-containing phosphotransfer) domain-containing protein